MPEFTSEEMFEITGRGRVFVVLAGEHGNTALAGQRVLIDGYVFTCAGVERFGVRPYPAHYRMGLLVKNANVL